MFLCVFAVYCGMDSNIVVCNRNDIGRFKSMPMFTRILVAMINSNDNAADNIGYDRSLDRLLLIEQANSIVSSRLEVVMGSSTFETINFHLRLLVGADLSQVASNPSLVEDGLRTLFGSGAWMLIEAAILAVFRSEHLIPKRDYRSFEEAIEELCSLALINNLNDPIANHQSQD